MITLLKILGWLLIMLIDIPIVIYRGIVLASLWFWFMVPLGVKPVGTAHAIGISMLLGLFTLGLAKKEKSKDDETPLWAWAVGKQFGSALMVTLSWWIGSIVHSYM